MDWGTILMVVLMGGAVYFLMIRPQQKRTKEQKEKLAALGPGSRVMTVSGIIGTVKHLGEKQAILELAPGVEMTVVKAAISSQPVDDEFEYATDADEVVDEPDVIEADGVVFDPTRPVESEGTVVSDAEPADVPKPDSKN